jgi:uncharacterized protein (DUF736 family)
MTTYQNIAALWKKKDKNGKTYLSFKAEVDIKAGDSFSLFQNDKNGVESRPDFRAYKKIEETEEFEDNQGEDIADDIPF